MSSTNYKIAFLEHVRSTINTAEIRKFAAERIDIYKACIFILHSLQLDHRFRSDFERRRNVCRLGGAFLFDALFANDFACLPSVRMVLPSR